MKTEAVQVTTNTGVPRTARERGKVAPVKLAHLVLKTADAPRLVAWYCAVLEAEVALSNGMLSFLAYDDEHHRVAIMQFPGVSAPPPGTTGLEHFAFTYEDADALFATYERLKGLGIEPYWAINHGPTLSIYYRDPDGNQVELQIDLQSTIEELNAWFATSDFATNPIGVKLDLEDVIHRYRAGEDPKALFARPVIDRSQVRAQLPDAPARTPHGDSQS